MIPLLRVIQRVSFHYYNIIAYYYVIFQAGSIITHYYWFQSAELADDLPAPILGLFPCPLAIESLEDFVCTV